MDPEEKQVERQRTGEQLYDATVGAKVPRWMKKEIEDIAKEQGHPTVSSFLRSVFERLILDGNRRKNLPRMKLTDKSATDDAASAIYVLGDR